MGTAPTDIVRWRNDNSIYSIIVRTAPIDSAGTVSYKGVPMAYSGLHLVIYAATENPSVWDMALLRSVWTGKDHGSYGVSYQDA